MPDEIRGRVATAEFAGMTFTLSSSTWTVGRLLDRGVAPRALMAGCGLVALFPIVFWLAVQPAFEQREEQAAA